MQRRCRVLLVENDPGIGGSGRSLQTLIAALDRSRFDLSVVCLPDGPIGRAIQRLGVTCHWPKRRLTKSHRIVSQARWVWWLRRTIRRHGIDLVHVNDVAGFRLAGVAARLARIPAVCHVRMAGSAEDLRWSFGLARPAALVFNSRAMAEHTRSVLPPSMRDVHAVIAPNAVDTDRFRPAESTAAPKARLGWPTEVLAVSVVGNLSPLKGQDVFLDAAGHVRDRFDGPVAFHLAGRDLTADGGWTQMLLGQIDGAGLQGHVTLHGPVDDVVPVYQASDVVVWPGRSASVCPSGDGTRVFQVGFPRCVIESAACGRPLILADTPGAAEAAVPGETGLFVPPEDPSAMAEAILTLLRDPNRLESMGRAARQLSVTRFGIEAHGRLIGNIYESVLDEWAMWHGTNSRVPRLTAASMPGGST